MEPSEGDATGWFDPLYSRAARDASRIPWAREEPHPYLTGWLDGRGGAGERCLVVGCGLGDDAETLAATGYEVTAFDVSAEAVAWARERFPASDVTYLVADLLAPPEEWSGAFDLVFESRTWQSLPEGPRPEAMRRAASFVAPGGTLLAISLMATRSEVAASWQGPPWPLAPSELAELSRAGLQRVSLEHPPTPGPDGVMEVRLVMRRPA